MSEGYEDLRQVPADRIPTPALQRVHRVTVSGKAEINPGAAERINALSWPRYYLDFETIAFTVPIWPGTRPFQALPFQWSCHGVSNTGEIAHREFLDISGESPMRRFAESLIETLGSSGPILDYSPYEKRIINELTQTYPDIESSLKALAERLVDLLPITKQHYYHPAMKGSWSIKAVLPTVAPDIDYAALGEVHDGTSAQFAYLELIDPSTESNARSKPGTVRSLSARRLRIAPAPRTPGIKECHRSGSKRAPNGLKNVVTKCLLISGRLTGVDGHRHSLRWIRGDRIKNMLVALIKAPPIHDQTLSELWQDLLIYIRQVVAAADGCDFFFARSLANKYRYVVPRRPFPGDRFQQISRRQSGRRDLCLVPNVVSR